MTVTLLDVIQIGFSFLTCSQRWPPTPTKTQKQFLQDLTITRGAFNQSGMRLHGPSEGRGGRKRAISFSQSLTFLLLCFFPSSVLFLFLTFAFLHGYIPGDFILTIQTNPPYSAIFSFCSRASCLTISWHAHREHHSSPQFLLLALHPALSSSSFSLLSASPCVTISRHALRESDEYFSRHEEGLQPSASSSLASNTTNEPESVFFLCTTLCWTWVVGLLSSL